MVTNRRTETKTDPLLQPGQLLLIDSAIYPRPIEGIIMHVNEKHLAISVDTLTDDEYTASPAAGSEITLRIFNKHGHYETIVNYLGNSPLPQKYFFTERPQRLISSQMREFARISASLPVIFRIKTALNGYTDMKQSSLVDISGNGLCFIADKAINRSTEIFLLISSLPNIDRFPISGTVARCRQVQTSSGYVYHIGVSFKNTISQAEQTKLLSALTSLKHDYLNL